jgi:hypothetical protein
MKDFRQKLKEGLTNISKNAVETSGTALNKLKEGTEQLGNMGAGLGAGAVDKVANVVNDLIATLPLLEEAGYRTNEFNIQVALSPVITLHFSKMGTLQEEELQVLKERYSDRKMFQMILKLLSTASALWPKIKADDFHSEEIIVDVSVPPSVSLRYVRSQGEVIRLLEEE